MNIAVLVFFVLNLKGFVQSKTELTVESKTSSDPQANEIALNEPNLKIKTVIELQETVEQSAPNANRLPINKPSSSELMPKQSKTHHASAEEFEKQQAHLSDEEIFNNLCNKSADILFEVADKCSKHEQNILHFIKTHSEKHIEFDSKYVEHALEHLPKEFICFDHELHDTLWQCMCEFCAMPIFASIENPESLYYKWRYEYNKQGCDKEKPFLSRPDNMCKWMGLQYPNTNFDKEKESNNQKQEKRHSRAAKQAHKSIRRSRNDDFSSSPVPLINYTWMAVVFTAIIASLSAFLLLVK